MPETPTKAFRKGAGRVAFLANKDLFRSLLDQGYPQTAIYAEHASSLGISYPQFTRYVARYLTNKESGIEQQNEVSSRRATPSTGGREKPERVENAPALPSAQKPEAKRPGQVGRKFEHKSVPDDKLV